MKRGEAKRLALLQATARLITEKGIAALTTREIAERAGSTERTLFKQFGSKEGLLTAVLDMVATTQVARSRFADLMTDPPLTLDAFEGWHRRLIAERLESPTTRSHVGRLFLMEIIQNEGFKMRYAETWRAGIWQPLVQCLDALKAAGEIADFADTRLLAHGFISLNLGYLLGRLQVAPQLDWDTERDAAGIAALFRRGIAPV
ncbi:MAG TPA: helix-turn-helix domain-containing protein [Allosphingosinicella sp.]|nr:helix-turn-helix domain-containing protein [Allosphingosinicella sp.]